MSITPSGPSRTAQYRDFLANLDSDQLTTLFGHRPDAAVPPPPGPAPLATRLLLRTSIARTLGNCSADLLAALERAANLGAELEEVDATTVAAAPITDALCERALLYRTSPDKVMLPAEVMPALPTGWSLLNQVEVTPADLAQLPEAQLEVLQGIAHAGGASAASTFAKEPVAKLEERGFVLRPEPGTLRLPRAVLGAVHGREHPVIPLEPIAPPEEPHPDPAADAAGAASGLDVARELERVIEHLGRSPVSLLKDKSVGKASVKQLAKALSLPEPSITRLIHLGYSASLLGRGEPSGYEGNFLAPTAAATDWQDLALGERWQALIEAWMASPWQSWSAKRPLDKEAVDAHLPGYRQRVLEVYRHRARALSAEEFAAELRFSSPLFALLTGEETIAGLAGEAQWLGLIARGRATTALTGNATDLTPEEISYFLLQGDLSVIAPGPLTSPVQAKLALIADLESPGLASTYRLSEESVRRGFDAGWSAADFQDFFSEHSAGEVPQPVSYLVQDSARRHGALRAGPANAYLRSDDPAVLAQAVSAVPELRLLAPTVAVSQLPLRTLLDKLHRAGLSPAAEDAVGATVQVAPPRATVPPPKAFHPSASQLSPAALNAAVDAVRAGRPDEPTAATGPDLDLLQAAVRSGRAVVIGYATKTGTQKSLRATPLTVSGGQVDARAQARTVRIPLSRITSLALD